MSIAWTWTFRASGGTSIEHKEREVPSLMKDRETHKEWTVILVSWLMLL